MENSGICKLCDSHTLLQKSHAIPDSYFRRIFKDKSGKGILISEQNEDITTTSDSWSTFQLCKSCESLINEQYEKYSIALLRNSENTVKNNKRIIFKKVDVEKFYMFCISIFWRAALSGHPAYSGAVMPKEFYDNGMNGKIKEAIKTGNSIPTRNISLKMSRLKDDTGRWDMKDLKNLIVPPFHRPYKRTTKVSVNFVIEGFFITFIMPGLPSKFWKSEHIIRKTKNSIIVPFLNIHHDPHLTRIIQIMDSKIESQKVRKSVLN